MDELQAVAQVTGDRERLPGLHRSVAVELLGKRLPFDELHGQKRCLETPVTGGQHEQLVDPADVRATDLARQVHLSAEALEDLMRSDHLRPDGL
jgi:hypothetical protein